MNKYLKIFFLILAALGSVALMLFAGAYLFLAFCFIFTFGLISQLLGIPISVKKNRKVIGYIRFFKFYSKDSQ